MLSNCFRFKYAVFRKKITPFEAVNRKNNFQEVLTSLNGGNWKVPGEEITRILTDCRNTMRGEKVIDKLKHTSHHFVELMPKRYWKYTSQKNERFDFQFLLKVFNLESFLSVFFLD